MATIIRCSCGKKVRIDEKYFGHRVRCPSCGTIHVEPLPPAKNMPLAMPVAAPPAEDEIDIGRALAEEAPAVPAGKEHAAETDMEVEWDEEQPVAPAPVPAAADDFAGLIDEEEEAPRPKSKRPAPLEIEEDEIEVVEEIEEEPAARAEEDIDISSLIEEDEEEAPPPKAKKRRRDEDEEEDTPPPRAKKRSKGGDSEHFLPTDEPTSKPAWELAKPERAIDLEPAAPLVWHTGQKKQNVFVLTDNALYVATVAPKLLNDVDRRLETGESVADVLPDNALVLPLRSLLRLRYKQAHSKQFPDVRLDLFYNEGGKEKRLRLLFGAPDHRDGFAEHLSELVDWVVSERPEPRWSLGLQYGLLLAFVIAGTGLVVYLEMTTRDRTGPWLYYLLVDNFGIWGLIGVGAVLSLGVLALAIPVFLKPPRILTYAPDATD